ncbi:MAG: hypothetical protein WB508_11690 [Aeromicrobium sp.]|uniref:hypothetical protein n=1 Tax=Aeromicrobium sp. TaxID=1871063 RepID=UPI003C5617F6
MDRSDDDRRRGEPEFDIAARSAAFAVVAVLLAQVTSASTAPIALATTFLLYLGAILAGLRTVVAIWVAIWKRRQR